MIQRINRKNYNIFAFDIESHNSYKNIERMETSMWLGCLINDESNIRDSSCYLYNMSEFLDRLNTMTEGKRHSSKEKRPCKNVAIYIYNLSFEWSFILPELIKQGFTYKEVIEEEDEFVYNTISTKSVSSVWMIQIKFGKKHGIVLFRDLAKIFGGGLGKVAKAFNLPTQKGSINYRKDREWKRKPYRVTCKEKVYCFKDTRIIIDILLALRDDRDFWNVTSMASYSMKKLLKAAYPRDIKPYKSFREDYPELEEEETQFLRHATSGGITYAPSRWQFKEIEQNILHIDAHQMHPTQMYTKLFPYGKGTYFKGRPTCINNINCCHIKISYSYVKIHSVIELIGLDTIEDKEIWVWDFEIPTMLKCYEELSIEYIDGYSYKCRPFKGKNYVKVNYNRRLLAKKEHDEFYTLYYKLLNNSSYGKFLEKPHNQIFKNIVREDGIIDSDVEDKDILNQSVNAKYTYLPVGSCIPAYSRVQLIETALKFNWKDILYFDTDSIFILATPENMNVWDTKIDHTDFLGGWGLEDISTRGQFTAPKRYKLLTEEGISIIKAAGINFENQVRYDEVNIVSSEWKVQRAYRCKGGTVIAFQDKKMDVQDKYKSIYLANSKNCDI